MEQKKELTLDEMGKASGGVNDQEENRRYEVGHICPHCDKEFATYSLKRNHIRAEHPDKA